MGCAKADGAERWRGQVKVFFCKYNDPIFVKMEKLDVLVMLASDRNIDQVLLASYAAPARIRIAPCSAEPG